MANVKIGWSKKETSIAENVALFGQMYLRVSEGIHDPLYASALVVDGGEGHVIFCTCDLEAHREDSISETIARVRALRPEISPDSILMGVTHSHTAGSILETPAHSPDGKPVYDGLKYRQFLISRCVDAIVEAWDNRREGGIAYGYGYAVVGNSRRVVFSRDMSIGKSNRGIAPNGHGVMYGRTDREEFRHYEAGADHFLNLLYTFDKDNKLTGVVVNTACPSQLTEHLLFQSSDFWHDVRTSVAEEFGDQVFVLPQCAAAGDIDPRMLHYKKAHARRLRLKYGIDFPGGDAYAKENEELRVMAERRDVAEQLMGGIREVYAWAKKDIRTSLPVESVGLDLQLERRRITDGEKRWCEETLEMMEKNLPSPDSEDYSKAITTFRSVQNRNRVALMRYEEQKTDPTIAKRVYVARIGDVAFATCPYELFMDYMHRIQARSPFLQTFVIQLAGDQGAGYLATERAMANKGYSASIFCNRVGAEGGRQYVEAVLDTLGKMAE